MPCQDAKPAAASDLDRLKDHAEVADFKGVKVQGTSMPNQNKILSRYGRQKKISVLIYVSFQNLLRLDRQQVIGPAESEPPTPHLRATVGMMNRLDTAQLEARCVGCGDKQCTHMHIYKIC